MHGDFAKLAMLIDKLRTFGDDVKRETAVVLRLELLDLVQQGFRDDVDPYGEAWEPLKHRSGDILENSRIMANSFNVQPVWPLVITNNVEYVNFHQDGTKKKDANGDERQIVPRRRMVPEPNELPPRWAGPLTRATELVVDYLSRAMPT